MPDGTQHAFAFTLPQQSKLRPGEIVLDFFAGGGGASEALRQTLGRDPDVAVNHDPQALGMHAANHPLTRHMEADVWTIDIVREVAGQRVGWFHASPDCTHFSQAKGGQPRSRATRSLSWVVLKVAGTLARRGLAPRIISLENVRQIMSWGSLIAKRDKATGRVLRLDGSVAAPGERVPLRDQFLIPDKRRAGQTWRQFIAALRALGYAVEWRTLRACDYGAGTSRERLFLIARLDGEPIRWPEPTHGPGRAHPYVTAADCIDWSIPCPSIFARRRPLADATCRRIARGVQRYVLDAAQPFIVQCANAATSGIASSDDPRGDSTGASCAETLTTPFNAPYTFPARSAYVEDPLAKCEPRDGVENRASATLAPSEMPGSTPSRAPVIAFLEQANGGGENGVPARARSAVEPVSTITATGSQQRVVTAHLVTNTTRHRGARADEPVPTITAAGNHAVVECTLSPEHEAGALRVAAFLINYYGNGAPRDPRAPLDTITTRDRLALVTVTLHGTPYVIVDIGLRMLRPAELYRAQGFPPDYIIDRTARGAPLTISAQVRMVGNSVSPPPLAAIARANLDTACVSERVAA